MAGHLSRRRFVCKYYNIFVIVCLIYLVKSGNPHQLGNDERVHFNGYKVFRIVPMTDDQLQVLNNLAQDDHGGNFDFWKVPTTMHEPADVMVSPEKVADLERLLVHNKIPQTVLISDVERHIQKGKVEFSSKNKFSSDNQTFFEDYRSLDKIHDHMDKLAEKYSHIATIISVGKSAEGRDLKAIKIGDKLPDSTRPIIWIDGGTHAREWISISTVTYIITKLVEGYGEDEKVKELVDTYNWYILPVLNVDGYEYSTTTNRMWRKNRRQAVSTFRNCIGVDLNRNWGFYWSEGTMGVDPCHETYSGPGALSEPESKAVSEYVLQKKDYIKVFLSMHAYGQFWLTPWGYTRELPKNYASLVAVAREATDALSKIHGTKYTIGAVSRIMYLAPGGAGDWALGVAKINYSYTAELRPIHDHGFLLPPKYILPTGEETLAGVKALAEAVKREL